MFHVMLFIVACVIVAYACIAFRDDPKTIDPFEEILRQREERMAMQCPPHMNGATDSSRQRTVQRQRRPFTKVAL